MGASYHRCRGVGRKDSPLCILCYNNARKLKNGQRSSEVEQRFRKPPVVGSIPTAGSSMVGSNYTSSLNAMRE